MKANIMTDEQLDYLSNDIAEMITHLESIKKEFDATEIKKELIKEIQIGLRDNTIFSKLNEESLELDQNLKMLKRVGKSFQECAHEKLIKTVLVVMASTTFGIIISSIFWYFK